MKQITKDLKVIKMRKALKKAREEYHSFMRVRELKDINSSCSLVVTMLRLEDNLLKAKIALVKVID
jgi:hypothetical protein